VARHRLSGYAIVSANDCIADALGHFPDSLRNEADWIYFQTALDRADLTLLGRRSHDATPNPKGRKRLIMTRSVDTLATLPEGVFWNPAGAPLHDAIEHASPGCVRVAVVGGQDCFDVVGAERMSSFHLAKQENVNLERGRGLFAVCENGVPAEDVLRAGGLTPAQSTWLDRQAKVSLVVWRQADFSPADEHA